MAIKKKRSEVPVYHLSFHGTNRQFANFGMLDPDTIAKLKTRHPEYDWRSEKIAHHFTDDENLAREYGNRIVKGLIDTSEFKVFNFRGYNWKSDHGEKLNSVIEKAKEKGFKGLWAKDIVISGKDPESTNIKSDNFITWSNHTVRNVVSGEEMFEEFLTDENEAGLSRVTSGSSFHQASSNAPEGKIKLPTVLDAGALAKTKTPDFFNYFRDLHADNKKIIQKQQEQLQKQQEKAQKQQEKVIKKQEQIMKQQEQQQKKAAKEQQKALKRMFESVQRYSLFITEQNVKTAPDFSRPNHPPPTDAPPATTPPSNTPPDTQGLGPLLDPYASSVSQIFTRQGAGNLLDKIKKIAPQQRFPTNSINQPPTGNMEILRPSAPLPGQSQTDSDLAYQNRLKQQQNFDTTGIDPNTKKMADHIMGGLPQHESVIDRFLELEKTPGGNQFARAKKLHEIFGKDNNQLPLKKNGSGDQMATTVPTRDLTDAVIRKEGGKQGAFSGNPFSAAGVSGSPGTQSGPAPSKVNDQPSSAGDTISSGGGSGGGASPEEQQSRQGAFSGDPFSAAGMKGMSGTQSGGDGKSPTTGPSITGTQTSVQGGPPEKLPVSPEGGKRRNANKG